MAFRIEDQKIVPGNIGDRRLLARFSLDLENLDPKIIELFDTGRVEFMVDDDLEIQGLLTRDGEALRLILALLG